MEPFDLSTLDGVVQAAKAIAKHYRELTGKPLGITGEVGSQPPLGVAETRLPALSAATSCVVSRRLSAAASAWGSTESALAARPCNGQPSGSWPIPGRSSPPG